jgi:hypothetical protein
VPLERTFNLSRDDLQRANQGGVSEVLDIISTRGMIAQSYKQQIPPLRCAPVGMTHLW